ncbi:MAG: hypothetical protein ABI947_26690 [Chloroflexota bacterium]
MDWNQFSKSLVELGFFRYLKPGKEKTIPRLLTKIRSTNYIFGVTEYRDYPADEEDIGEGGAKEFLSDIKYVLNANGVVFTSIEEMPTPDAQKLLINGEEYILCSGEELNQSPWRIKHTITKRLFAVINKLLREAGSKERIFSRDGGNDHWAIFLTYELYDLLAKSDFADDIKELRLYEE